MKLINKFPDFILNLLLKITTFELISFNLIYHKLKFSLKFAKILLFSLSAWLFSIPEIDIHIT